MKVFVVVRPAASIYSDEPAEENECNKCVFFFFLLNDDEDMIKPVRIRCVGTFDYGKQQRALCYSDKDNQKVQLTVDIIDIFRFFKISYLFIEIVSSLDQHLSLNLLRTCAVQSVGRIYIYY